MKLVLLALRRPVTIAVCVLAIMLLAGLAVVRMPVDIFPQLGAPAIYVAQPYGGMDPVQMEGFLTYYYEYHFLYITGIEHVESKSIQGASLMKLVFHPGTDMSAAMAEVVGYVGRARAFMPPGTVGPFITRFDAGSVPVGQLVFSSPTKNAGELQNIALNLVRPLFATLEGVSAPPPFGGNQKSILVRVQPEKLRQYHLSPDEVMMAVSRASTVLPSGNVRVGDLNYIATSNAALGAKLDELLDAMVRPGVYLRDVASIEAGTDIVTGYAHVNGKRTVYIQVTKRADASTLRVIERVKKALPDMRKVCPDDVSVTLEFDQSGFVRAAIQNLGTEAVLGALLTGLTVLLFLRDWRGALIVVTTIPVALLSAVVWLWAFGQTINIMTLGGLALAVGVLVDEATVEIENIHSHMASGLERGQAVVDACRKTATPRLLAMVSILAVFVPAAFMTGVVRQLFVPLALAVACAMVSSYVLSSTLVPVMATRLLRTGHGGDEAGRMRRWYGAYLDAVLGLRWPLVGLYLVTSIGLLMWLAPGIGREVFPESGQELFQLRLRAPSGTRIEKTEQIALKTLAVIQREAGKENVEITTGFIGVQPPSYPINTIFLWTSGPQEAVLKVALKKGAPVQGAALRERLRGALARELPDTTFSFEPGDIIGQVMSGGASAPVEVAVQGPSVANNRAHAEKVRVELAKIGVLRDLQYAQAMDYPALDVKIDRQRAGQFGLTMSQVARSMVAATSSSRFVEPNYWRDPATGNAFQIQVEIPYQRMDSAQALMNVPVMENGEARPLLGDVAEIKTGTTMGLVERYNMQRVVSLTANVQGAALSTAAAEIEAAVKRAGEPAKGVSVKVRGQIPALLETESNLKYGIAASLVAIFLLLAAFFESFRLALAVVLTAPAVLVGVVLALLATGTTMNVQSFLGAIMATGIAVANSILLCSFAERARAEGSDVVAAARSGAAGRLRAILMTAAAMIAGMIPMALGWGEGGAQTAPLGRAVIGGLLFATVATLTVLPAVYAVVMSGRKTDAA
ncbi:MAG TPA: efflux RND transporter permease subunit [Paludibaculum sp.]